MRPAVRSSLFSYTKTKTACRVKASGFDLCVLLFLTNKMQALLKFYAVGVVRSIGEGLLDTGDGEIDRLLRCGADILALGERAAKHG